MTMCGWPNRARLGAQVVLVIVSMALCAGCAPEDWSAEELAHGTAPAIARSSLEKGRRVYARYCVGCHGPEGDGEGPAARFLHPRPRDFRVGQLKFASVEAGQVPRDEDYERIIREGLAGTSMPAFPLLPHDETDALIGYLRTFAEDPDVAAAPPAAIPEDPWMDDPEEAVVVGERLYHTKAQCWSCHPAYVSRSRLESLYREAGQAFGGFRDDMYVAIDKDSQWGAPPRGPAFLVHRVKAGRTLHDLARVLAPGVGGTALPSWAAALPPEDLWGLAYYVRSLVVLRDSPEGRERMAGARLGETGDDAEEVAP